MCENLNDEEKNFSRKRVTKRKKEKLNNLEDDQKTA